MEQLRGFSAVFALAVGYVALCGQHSASGAPERTDLESKEFHEGLLKLIIHAFAEGLAGELSDTLTPHQLSRLKHKLRELPDHIRDHPAIGQKHLWVGKGRPPMHGRKDAETTRKERHALAARRKWMMNKREGALSLPSEEICQTTTQWEQLNRTQDYDGREVEIVQDEIQQYVFSYRCVSTSNACNAISNTYDSECTERKGWMYLYYKPLEGEERNARWGYVSVNHHCVCKVTPKGVL